MYSLSVGASASIAKSAVAGPAPRAEEIGRMMHRGHVRPPVPRQPARSLHAAKPNSHLRYGIAGEAHPSAEIFDDRCMTLRSSFIMGLRAETGYMVRRHTGFDSD